MSMEIIQSAATELLVNVALAVLALAGAYAVYYIRLGTSKLKAQTAQIEDASTRKVLDDALEDVANLATLSVGAMEQTTAKALREAVKGGKASREELVALGKQVFDEVKASIAPEAQRVITKNLGSFDEYLTKCIEAAVLEDQAERAVHHPPGECAHRRRSGTVRRAAHGRLSDHRPHRRGGVAAVHRRRRGAHLLYEEDAHQS